MAVACVAMILAGNMELAWRFEHASFPLSWAFAGAALLAFLAFEICEGEDRSAQSSLEWESAEEWEAELVDR